MGKKKYVWPLMVLLLVLLFISGCATIPQDDLSSPDCYDQSLTEAQQDSCLDQEEKIANGAINDPLEPMNRLFFGFNNRLWLRVIFPAKDIYIEYTPNPLKDGASNFVHNICFPVRFVSNLGQFKFNGAALELGAFMINSSWGILGIFDIVKEDNDLDDEDISQLLAYWGVPAGPYIEWPILGSSNLRNSIGSASGIYITQFLYGDYSFYNGIKAIEFIDGVPDKSKYEDLLKYTLDPYIAKRTAYYEYFNKLVEK